MTNYDDYYGTMTYVDPAVYYKTENFNHYGHREFVLRRDPNIHTYIHKLDEEIWQELPLTEPELTDNIREEWQMENWSDLMTKMFDWTRIHRWCIVVLYDEYPYWRVFGPREVLSIEFDGEVPISADIKWWRRLPRTTKGQMFTQSIDFSSDSALFVRYGSPQSQWFSSSDLEHIWTLATQLRYINTDISRNSAKSSGFYFIQLGQHSTRQDKRDLESAMESVNYGNSLASKVNKIEEIKDIHPKNAKFSIEAYNKFLKEFAGACRLPLSFFNGETEKAGIGKENKSSEEMMINKKKKALFGHFKTPIMELMEMRWGMPLKDVWLNIEETEEEEYKDEIIEQNQEGIENE